MSLDHIDYMELARFFGSFSTCRRAKVGAVLVRDRRIISTGYNGAPAGLPHCDHDDVTFCDRAVHAEANTIAFAARSGIATNNTTLYVTASPCLSCAQLIINAGVGEVNYGEEYRLTDGIELFREAGIQTYDLGKSRVRPMSAEPRHRAGMYPCDTCGEEVEEGALHMCGGSAGS